MSWVKLWNRKHTSQHNLLGRFFWFIDNPYYNLKNILSVSVEKGKHDFYAKEKEWNLLMKKIAKEVFQSGFLTRNLKKFKNDKNKFRKIALKLSNRQELKKITNKELLKRYLDLKKSYLKYTYFFWSPWAINQEVVPWFEKELKKKFPQEAEAIFEIVTTPTKHILMDKQRFWLLRYKIKGKLNQKVINHVEKYQWLGVYSLLDKPWTKKDFLNQIKDIKNPEKYLLKQKKLLSKRRKLFKDALNKLSKYPKLQRIARILNEYAWFRTERVDVWREVLFLCQPFYRELETRMKLKKNQAPHLTYQEVVDFLGQGKMPKAEEVKAGELLFLKNGEYKVIRDSVEIKKVLQRELKTIDYEKIKIIKGVVTCKGRARGRVRIVMTPEDCQIMKKGEILVSNMTHPDYLLGFKKAKAVVTDEGGISCHAAIVSREMNKPCIIGTKIATRVLKDGDLVEVDANKGIVKIKGVK